MPFDGILPIAGFIKIVNVVHSLRTHTQHGFIVSQRRFAVNVQEVLKLQIK